MQTRKTELNDKREDFERFWKKVEEITGTKNKVKNAKEAGTSALSVRRKRSTNKIDANWAYEIRKKYGISTEWLLFGTGPQKVSDLEDIDRKEREIAELIDKTRKRLGR